MNEWIFKIFVLCSGICNTLCICLHVMRKIFMYNLILGSLNKQFSKHFNFVKNCTVMLNLHMETYMHFCSRLACNPLRIYQGEKKALNKSCREKWFTHFMTDNFSVNRRVFKIFKLKGLNAPELLSYVYVS